MQVAPGESQFSPPTSTGEHSPIVAPVLTAIPVRSKSTPSTTMKPTSGPPASELKFRLSIVPLVPVVNGGFVDPGSTVKVPAPDVGQAGGGGLLPDDQIMQPEVTPLPLTSTVPFPLSSTADPPIAAAIVRFGETRSANTPTIGSQNAHRVNRSHDMYSSPASCFFFFFGSSPGLLTKRLFSSGLVPLW